MLGLDGPSSPRKDAARGEQQLFCASGQWGVQPEKGPLWVGGSSQGAQILRARFHSPCSSHQSNSSFLLQILLIQMFPAGDKGALNCGEAF